MQTCKQKSIFHAYYKSTLGIPLKHFNFFLVVRPTKQLSLLNYELVTSLKANSTNDTDEAPQVKDAVQSSHDEFVGTYLLATAQALLGIYPVKIIFKSNDDYEIFVNLC